MNTIEQKIKGTSKTMEIHTTRLNQHQTTVWYVSLVLIVCAIIMYCSRTGRRYQIYGGKP